MHTLKLNQSMEGLMLHGGFFIHLFSQWYLHVYIWHIVIRIEILMNHNFYQICLKTWKDAILRDSYTEKKSKPYQTTSRLVSVQTGMKW